MKTLLVGGETVLVDDADYETVAALRWRLDGRCYARHCHREFGREVSFSMQKFIMQPPAGLEVDHINGNRLDNRRSNLRLATRSQNMANRRPYGRLSQYKGVAPAQSGKWTACIRRGAKMWHLGTFASAVHAACAFDAAALAIHGEFARPNFERLDGPA